MGRRCWRWCGRAEAIDGGTSDGWRHGWTQPKGKVALITGAGGMKEVGRAVAVKLARTGADLALTDVELRPEDRHPNQVRTGWRGIESVAVEARTLMGKDRVPITELTDEVWAHFLAINLTAPMILTRLVAREMIRRGEGGRIVNIGSDTSKRATAMGATYGNTKQGLVALTSDEAAFITGQAYNVNGGLLFN